MTFNKTDMTIFKSWEEAEEAFYKVNDCISDDSDKEGARVERWVEDCGHKVHEEEHTMKEWNEIKNKNKKIKMKTSQEIEAFIKAKIDIQGYTFACARIIDMDLFEIPNLLRTVADDIEEEINKQKKDNE